MFHPASANNFFDSNNSAFTANANFSEPVNKSWAHPDQQLSPNNGVTYGVRYVGAMPVKISIRTVDFDTRTKIARECIHRVCEEVHLKPPNNKRKRDKKVSGIVGPFVDTTNAMCNANITITTDSIVLNNLDVDGIIARHPLSNISFASGGDEDTMDFVSYVAKVNDTDRACYVIECQSGLAKEIINTIGQAFQIRYKEYVDKTSSRWHPSNNHSSSANQKSNNPWSEEPVASPRSGAANNNPFSQNFRREQNAQPPAPAAMPYNRQTSNPNNPWSNNLNTNQLNSRDPGMPPPTEPSSGRTQPTAASSDQNVGQLIDIFDASIHHSYAQVKKPERSMRLNIPPKLSISSVDSDDFNPRAGEDNQSMPPGPFLSNTDGWSSPVGPCPPPFPTVAATGLNGRFQDLNISRPSQQLNNTSPDAQSPTVNSGVNLSSDLGKNLEPRSERWYLGPMSRAEAEQLLHYDGDFLVRASIQQPGQYILSGRQDNKCRHLLLVDPNGQVRTKDCKFDSISHLIQFHIDHARPIKSADSELQLIFPITSRETFK